MEKIAWLVLTLVTLAAAIAAQWRPEVAPDVVEVEVAVPRLRLTEW